MRRNDCGSDSDSDSDWNEELINAVRKKEGKSESIGEKDRIKRIEECLNEGADVDALDKHRNTALHLALKKGYLRVVRFLRERRARIDIPNRNGQSALSLAEASGNGKILRAVREPGDIASEGTRKRQITSGDRGQDENGKRRLLDSAAIDAEGDEDDSELEDDIVFDVESVDSRTTPFERNERHAASGLKQTLHGNIYQLKLLMLFLRRGLREGYAFRLATEMDAAEKFDDLVFQYANKTGSGTIHRFLQAKHKQDERKRIGARDLLTERDDEFSLQKYFISYRKIKKHSELSRCAFQDFILCTNIDFDFDGLRSAGIRFEELDEPDPFLDIVSSAKKTARYRFLVDEQSELYEILKRTAEAHAMAKTLVEHICESKDITLRNDLFKLYHTALAEEVIDVPRKQLAANFVRGENLSGRGVKFREIFCAEALKRTKLSVENTKEEKEDALWIEMQRNPLKVSSSFGQRFKLSSDPRLDPLGQFTEELAKLILGADSDKLVKVNKKIYRKNAREGSNERVFAENIDKLAGHVLVIDDEKIKFRSRFFDDNIRLPGNIGDLRNLLKARLGGVLYDDLHRHRFEMNNFKTCEEDQLHSKTELPGDDVAAEEIDEFFDKLVFAVNQPNETELGDALTREIAADTQFNLLNADLVGDSFQKEMLDWFKEKGTERGKEGRFFTSDDGRAFFDSAERKVNTLVSSGLGLSYPEELEEYGVEFERENGELREFLTHDSLSLSDQRSKPVLNLIAASGDTLPTVVRVHRAIRRSGRYAETDSLMFIRLRTLRLTGVRRRVIRAFESPRSHRLLVVDCGSAGRQELLGLYERFRETTRRNVGKKLILVTGGNDRTGIRFKDCLETRDDPGFNDLTIESRYKLARRLVVRFQNEAITSFGNLLGIRSRDDLLAEEVRCFGESVDTGTMVKLIRSEEIRVGNELEGLGDVENYYVNRNIDPRVFIKNDIFTSKPKFDLFAISGVNRGTLLSLAADREKVRSFNEIDPREQHVNEFVILDAAREAEQFRMLCENPISNVHWLRSERGEFVWKKTRGSIASLVEHRDVGVIGRGRDDCGVDKGTVRSLTENQLADHGEGRRLVIIADSAGMGKTTVFTYLARKLKETRPGLWVIRVNLNDHAGALLQEKTRRSFRGDDIDGAIEFFVEKLSDLGSDLEKRVLRIMIRKGGVGLLLDGFDEISPDYKDTVIDLLRSCQKIGLPEIFVATRPHMRAILEDNLGTFSCAMEPFSRENQTDFLVRFWRTGLGLDRDEERMEERLKTYARALTKKMAKSIGDRGEEFAGVPLQTRIIAEIFQDDGEGKKNGETAEAFETCERFLHSERGEPGLPEKLRIVELYRRFVDKKYFRYRTEKKKEDPANLGVDSDSEYLRERFLQWHQKLALRALFDSVSVSFLGPPILPMLLDRQETRNVDAYILEVVQGKERTGIVTRIVNGKPRFIHRTFAEYFSAVYLINTLKQSVDYNPKIREFVLKQLFLESTYKTVRAFLNGLLSEDSSLSHCRNANPEPLATESWKSALQDSRDLLGDTVLRRAAKEGNYEILKFILNRFDEHDETRRSLVNAKDPFGDTIPYIAANEQHWDDLIWLVENEGARIDSSTDSGRTPLHAAAFWGNLDVVQWLVRNGAAAEALSADGKTPLYEAVQSGKLDVLEWLLDVTKADVNSRNKYGKTVLHFAASIGQLDVVKWLVVAKNANLNARANDGKMVVHEAADKGRWEVVRWLIDEGRVDVNSKGAKAETIIKIAASAGDLDTVKWLVKKGADIDAMSSDRQTILHAAVYERRWAVFEWLVDRGANVNVRSWIGNTVLHETASRQKWDLVKWLVGEKNADTNVKGANDATVLHEAARRRRWDMVEWILENKEVDIDAVAGGQGTILYHAASQGKWDTVKWLIDERNADANVGGIDGMTALHCAAVNNNWDMVDWLVSVKNADVNARASDGRALVHHAASFGRFDLVRSLVDDKGIGVGARTNDGTTVLHCAVASGEMSLIKWLVEEKGADIEARTHGRETPLLTAASKRHWDVVEWLVNEKGADAQAGNREGFTALHAIARSRRWDLIRMLMDSNDVDITGESSSGDTVLGHAVESGDLDVVKWLIESKGGDNVGSKFRNGRTILHYAVVSGHLKIVEWLVDDKGADTRAVDANGRTLLHDAVASRRRGIVEWLVDRQASDPTVRDKDGRTLLHEAALVPDLDMIRLLVESYKVDALATDDCSETALDLYCKKFRWRRDDAVIQLLRQGDLHSRSEKLRRGRFGRRPRRTRGGPRTRPLNF